MDTQLLKQAIEQSRESAGRGGFPAGVVIAVGNRVFAVGTSSGTQNNDPTSHAEIAAIREACAKIGGRDLSSAVLYSSIEPCLMCYGASVWASVSKIVFACGRGRLPPEHFEGQHDLATINSTARKPLELVHIAELEQEALDVIEAWKITVDTK